MDKQIDSKTCYGQYILLIPYFEIHFNFVKIEAHENVKTFYVKGRRNAKYSLLDSKLNS